ncbi:MAG: ABC transporter permease subunit [Bacteroidetes bacterium]|nr:ABC transporter permease subunit [Bacteroidota bacterium]
MNRILFHMDIFFTMSLFRSVLEYQQQIMGMVKLVPMAAMKARGFGNINDIFSGLGFYAANNIVYMMLLGSIYSMVLTSNILLKEEYGKTAEFLMSRPVSRDEIFASKMAVAFLNIALLNLLAGFISFLSIEIFKSGDFRIQPFMILTLYTFLLNLFFGALGLLVAGLIRRARPVTFFCVGLVLVLYFLFTISRLSGVNGDFGYVSPFKWVNVEVLNPSYGAEFWRIFLFLGLTVLLVFLSGFLYRKKDILT